MQRIVQALPALPGFAVACGHAKANPAHPCPPMSFGVVHAMPTAVQDHVHILYRAVDLGRVNPRPTLRWAQICWEIEDMATSTTSIPSPKSSTGTDEGKSSSPMLPSTHSPKGALEVGSRHSTQSTRIRHRLCGPSLVVAVPPLHLLAASSRGESENSSCLRVEPSLEGCRCRSPNASHSCDEQNHLNRLVFHKAMLRTFVTIDGRR